MRSDELRRLRRVSSGSGARPPVRRGARWVGAKPMRPLAVRHGHRGWACAGSSQAWPRLGRPEALAFAAMLAGLPAGAEAQEVRVDRAVRTALVEAGPGERVPILIEYEAGELPVLSRVDGLQRRAAAVLAPLAALEGPGLEVRERFWIVPAAAAEADAEAVEALASQPGVRRVYLNERLPVTLEPASSVTVPPAFTSDAMRTIGADAVWMNGITGEGVTVALFDTGVDGENAMLASRWRGLRTGSRASWFDPFRRASAPQDLIGHGTQVAVTMAGALPAGDTLILADGTRIVAVSDVDVVTGTAPRAEWMAARIFDTFGGGLFTRRSVILQAFQWAMDPDGSPLTDDAPDVINNSWGIIGDPEMFDQCNDVIFSAIDAAEAAGIAVVFAAGNAGPASGSIQAPAGRDDPELRSFAVGATSGTDTDVSVASFSGRGPSPCGGGIKPEIVAPGTVPEVRAAGRRAARLTGFGVQGTSFSSPQVAGALALIKQLRPTITPEQAKRFLLQTARDIEAPGADNDAGFGLLDVPAAVQRAAVSFAGSFLQVAGVRLAPSEAYITLANRGNREWPGGRLEVSGPRGIRSERDIGPLGPGRSRGFRIPFQVGEWEGRLAVLVTAYDLSGGIALSRAVLLAPPNQFGGFVLAERGFRASGNDFGRLGRIARVPGFEWQGEELLPAGSFFVAGAGLLSDGIYATVQGQPELKSQPPAAETDWAPVRGLTDVGESTADVRFDDFEALKPIGLQVDARLRVSQEGGVGALAITALITNASGVRIPDVVPGVFADWDLPGGERLRWSAELEAFITEPRGAGGPITLLAADTTPVGMADVPLGTPGASGFYEIASGVLADDEFDEAVKLDLARGGSDDGLPGAGIATDRAPLLSAGPFDIAAGSSALVRFWLLVSQSEEAAATRLAQLRAEPPEPPSLAEEFVALPPFPNPLRVGVGAITFPFELPASMRRPGAVMRFELYDVAGRLLVERRIPVDPSSSLVAPRWDGRLAGGRKAAAGVYLFVFRLAGEARSGRILLLR
ncbi:MAG: S8 family serine peptidase [Gemmatimonadota bacterium]